jgi:hypothetical protein
MVDVKNKTCEYSGCVKHPTYAEAGAKKPRFCATHRDPDMVDVISKTCEYSGCSKQPTYAEAGAKKPRFCATHRDPDMVNVRNKTCEYSGCSKQPVFAEAGAKKTRFCATHRDPDMVDVKNKSCEYSGCSKQPVFAEAGAKKPRFCATHRDPDMVNVISKTCEYSGCSKKPTYAEAGAKKPRLCATHRDPDMVNVISKTCEYSGCSKQPMFAEAGARKPRFCATHRDPDMVDVKHKTCEYSGCVKRPTYAEAGARKPRFCATHRDPDMVNVRSKTCEFSGCNTQAIFGVPGYTASSCWKHRSIGMIAFPKKRCTKECCSSLGTHGIIEASKNTSRYCEEHAPNTGGYVDIVQRRCEKCQTLDALRNGLCSNCDPVARRTYEHAKENRVRDVFNARGLVYMSHDKVVDGGACDRYRPDFVFDAATHFVVVEVDENQHQNYAETCEKNRMLSIWQSLGLPTIFVRYNPDSYAPNDISIPKARGKDREEALCSWVSHLMKPQENPLARGNCCEVLYLYYDGYDAASVAQRSLASLANHVV